MSTHLVTRPSPMSIRDAEPTVRAIIEAARSGQSQSSSRMVWIASGLTGALLWASFPPLDWGPLGWIALVPLMLLIKPARRPQRTVLATYVSGFVAELCMLQWLRHGDPSMYVALVAMSIYMAAYFPAFVLLTRSAVHRLGVPLTLAAPTIWVGLEFFRAHLLTGFSWYDIGHTQYRWIELIQISDLVGAYGVSFIVAASAAAIASIVPERFLTRLGIGPSDEHEPSLGGDAPIERPMPARPARGSRVLPVALASGLVAAAVVYGYVRRAQAQFTEGPRIAVVQGNFTAQVKHDASEAMSIFGRHYTMTGDAVKFQPDIIMWPETMYRDPLMVRPPDMSEADLLRVAPRIPSFAWKSSHVFQSLHDLSRQAGAAMIIGVEAVVADHESLKRYNSAVLASPERGVAARYDKIHRVIFGEYIPLKDVFPFLRSFVPYGANFGIDAGSAPVPFDYKSWRLAPIICFEDTVPHLVRTVVTQLDRRPSDGKPVDCLVNLTNDGWFHGSSGLDQHLISAIFRCVECRKPMVRAVNTGISAVIDGDGVVVEPDVFIDADGQGRVGMRDPRTGRWRRQLNAVLVDSIPLDGRNSLYLRHGDWFAGACGFAVLFVLMQALVPKRWLARRR